MELRKQLSRIVSLENERNWYIQELFEKNTLPQLPKEVQLVKSPPEESENYNCFMYVLGLHENNNTLKETGGFLFSAFIEQLIDIGEMKEAHQKSVGDIVLYKNEEIHSNEFTHSGIVQEDGKIISKWSWGPILIHGLFDVPLSYGNSVGYYEPIVKEKALKLYQKHKSFNRK
ncbi:MAG: hypothetical protein WD471_01480 [Candidatus Paceibacterota bacterium]